MGGTAAFQANFAVTGGSAARQRPHIEVHRAPSPFSIQNLTATTTPAPTVTSSSGAATKTATGSAPPASPLQRDGHLLQH